MQNNFVCLIALFFSLSLHTAEQEQICKNTPTIIKFTPTHWLDKLWYGVSACSIYSTQNKPTGSLDQLSEHRLYYEFQTFALALSAVSTIALAATQRYYPLGILINTLINDCVYDAKQLTPTIYKILWGSRIASITLFAALGRSLFSGLAPRIGCTMIPVFNLGLHAYKMNRTAEIVNIPFHHIYDSWPARLRRFFNT